MTTSPRSRAKKANPANGTTHTLPSGGRVSIRNVNHLRARDVKEIVREVSSRIKTDDWMIEFVFISREALLRRVAFDWDLPYAAPDGREWSEIADDAALLEDLQAADYNRLMEVVEPFVAQALPNMALSGSQAPTTPANG